jgi:TldD protein
MIQPSPSSVKNLLRKAHLWTRRDWLAGNAAALIGVQSVPPLQSFLPSYSRVSLSRGEDTATRDELVQIAVEAACRAGAQYADARITYTMAQQLSFITLGRVTESVGIGVRALVNGAWGFTATPSGDITAVRQLAQNAVAQAKVNAGGLPRTVEMGSVPKAVGTWAMPVRIDPFTVPIEEKLAFLRFWVDYAEQQGVFIIQQNSGFHFIRQERVVATSDGAHFTQTVYESGGNILVGERNDSVELERLTAAAIGWELVLDADIPAQLRGVRKRIAAQRALRTNPQPAQVGRYTLVCDGKTTSALLDRTIGVSTQIDRALGYEANASGTSFLNDPLTMLGTFKVGSPLVNVTANRSVPNQLATVKWDDEGVEPQPFSLVKEGILVDYQTTREQATWLAPYYKHIGQPIRSHGCAATEDALCIPMQHMPNLELASATQIANLDALIADVPDGILVTEGVVSADFQARTGLLLGRIYEIKNGKLGHPLVGGGILFDTLDLWRNVIALGDASTQSVSASIAFPYNSMVERLAGLYPVKGEPPQRTSHSIRAGAVTIAKQALVHPRRKA